MSKFEIVEGAAKLAIEGLEHTPARAAVEAGERMAQNALNLFEKSSAGKKVDETLHELHIPDIEALKNIVVGKPGDGLPGGWFGAPLRKASEVSLLMRHGASDFMPGSSFYPDRIHDLLRPDELPSLLEGHMRAIHFTSPDAAHYVAENGLKYGKYGDATCMARAFGSAESTHYLAPNQYKGSVAVVMDMPHSQWQSHTNVFGPAPGVIPPQRIVGVVGMPRLEQPSINRDFVEPLREGFSGVRKRPVVFRRASSEAGQATAVPDSLKPGESPVW